MLQLYLVKSKNETGPYELRSGRARCVCPGRVAFDDLGVYGHVVAVAVQAATHAVITHY